MTSELIEQLENALVNSEGRDFTIRANFVREIIEALREPEAQAPVGIVNETGGVDWKDEIPWYTGMSLYASPPAPSGYVMVPREPTEAMKREGADFLPVTPGGATNECAGSVYRAMLAATEEGK